MKNNTASVPMPNGMGKNINAAIYLIGSPFRNRKPLMHNTLMQFDCNSLNIFVFHSFVSILLIARCSHCVWDGGRVVLLNLIIIIFCGSLEFCLELLNEFGLFCVVWWMYRIRSKCHRKRNAKINNKEGQKHIKTTYNCIQPAAITFEIIRNIRRLIVTSETKTAKTTTNDT